MRVCLSLCLVLALTVSGCAGSTAPPSATSPEPDAEAEVQPAPTEDSASRGADIGAEDQGPPPPPGDMDNDGIPDDQDDDIDGDGYLNAHETQAGSDPLDPLSVIYVGGWPYNPDKDAIIDPGWDSEPDLGTVMPNYQALDQHNDLVSLYDFAYQGKPVVLDVVTWTCDPCTAMADYFANGDPSVMDDYPFFADKYDIIRELIVNEDIYWITIIWTGAAIPVDQSDAALWEETWPTGLVTVLADTDRTLQSYLYVKAMPRIDVLDETMTLVSYCDNDVPCDSEIEGGGPGGPVAGLKWLLAHYNTLYGSE